MSDYGAQIGKRVQELMRDPDIMPSEAFRRAFAEAPPAPTLQDAVAAELVERFASAAPWFSLALMSNGQKRDTMESR